MSLHSKQKTRPARVRPVLASQVWGRKWEIICCRVSCFEGHTALCPPPPPQIIMTYLPNAFHPHPSLAVPIAVQSLSFLSSSHAFYWTHNILEVSWSFASVCSGVSKSLIARENQRAERCVPRCDNRVLGLQHCDSRRIFCSVISFGRARNVRTFRVHVAVRSDGNRTSLRPIRPPVSSPDAAQANVVPVPKDVWRNFSHPLDFLPLNEAKP